MNKNEKEVCEYCGVEISNGEAKYPKDSHYDVLCDACFRKHAGHTKDQEDFN